MSQTQHSRRKHSRPEDHTSRLRNSLPAAYVLQVIEIAAERGIKSAAVLKDTHLNPQILETPDQRIPAKDCARVIFNYLGLTDDHCLGLEFGLRTKPTAHGYLGYAAMSSKNLREAIELAIRYIQLRQRDVSLHLYLDGDEAVLEFIENHDLGPLRGMFLEGLMLCIYNLVGFLVGKRDIEGELWFEWPEPEYFAAFRKRLTNVRFNAPSVQIRLPATLLDMPLVMADSATVKLAVEQCEREMSLTAPGPENLLERLRNLLQPRDGSYPDLDTVAGSLFMSGRTLKRKLRERGTSFQSLLDESRYRQARQLLDNPDLSIQDIASALGYTDPACFTRAFRRWSGKSPSQARKASRPAETHSSN